MECLEDFPNLRVNVPVYGLEKLFGEAVKVNCSLKGIYKDFHCMVAGRHLVAENEVHIRKKL